MKKLERLTFSWRLIFVSAIIRSATNFKKQRNMPLNVIGPRFLEHFYIIKSGTGTSEKIIGYPALHTSIAFCAESGLQ